VVRFIQAICLFVFVGIRGLFFKNTVVSDQETQEAERLDRIRQPWKYRPNQD
jgi:hypothetical protein